MRSGSAESGNGGVCGRVGEGAYERDVQRGKVQTVWRMHVPPGKAWLKGKREQGKERIRTRIEEEGASYSGRAIVTTASTAFTRHKWQLGEEVRGRQRKMWKCREAERQGGRARGKETESEVLGRFC